MLIAAFVIAVIALGAALTSTIYIAGYLRAEGQGTAPPEDADEVAEKKKKMQAEQFERMMNYTPDRRRDTDE